ncbi:MAG: ribonuclease activity regulator protein RraA, partial [Gammaproteobacteria bacterium]|nr:ribonuclease activity regulator protein RraA [Gammaproteobacteria bacterium]
MTIFSVADLCDENNDVQVAQPIFKLFGKEQIFFGRIRTVKVLDDNSLVKKLLNEKVNGDVMVIDGGGSLNCSLVGDNLANIACQNG